MLEKKINEILERMRSVETKVDYIIEDLDYIRKYYRLDDLWGDHQS